VLKANYFICQHLPTGFSKAGSVGGASNLICNYAKGLTTFCFKAVEPQHREAEIFTNGPIQPTRAQYA
jgi:hypothetical protein